MTTLIRGRRRLWSVGGSTFAVALLGWVTLVLAARALGPFGYAEFTVLWGVFFTLAAVMFGVQQEITQALSAQAQDFDKSPTGGAPPSPVVVRALLVAVILIVILGGTAKWWASDLPSGKTLEISLAVAVGVAALAVQSGVTGVVVARDQLRVLAALVTLAALIRLAAVVGATTTAAGAGVVMLAVVSGSFAWMALLPVRSVRNALTATHPGSLRAFLGRSSAAIAASVSAGLLATGFPVLLELRTEGALPGSAGVLISGVILTRTPVLLPMNGFQLVLLVHLTKRRATLKRALAPVIRIVVPSTALLVGMAYAVGPPVQALMFGPPFRSERWVIAALTLAACCLVVLTISGTALMACHGLWEAAAGWIVAVFCTYALLGLNGSIEMRSASALIGGPFAGTLVHLGLLVRLTRRDRASRPEGDEAGQELL